MDPIDHRVSPTIKHVPLRPARSYPLEEQMYLDAWVDFATSRPQEWRRIFRTTGPIRQRAASVAASFITFMGCNGGAAFTHSAEQLAKSNAFMCSEDAFLAAWAVENKRLFGTNNNLRTVEYILARDTVIRPYDGRVQWNNVPNVTMDDIDIIESMVCWWSTADAQKIRDDVEEKISYHRAMNCIM